MENRNKIFGWILLVLGLLIIFWTLFSSYNIFTGRSLAPALFEEELALTAEKEVDLEDIEKIVEGQLKEIFPVEKINDLLNLIVSSILAGIMIFGGGRVAGIGIKLIKD